jgi:hypothetical protein
MKNKQLKIGLLITAIALVVIVPMHMAHAWNFGNLVGLDFFSWLAAFLINNILLPLASFFLYICGALLNKTIYFSLNIKAFVNQVPSVYTVWQSIRDVSGMLIIFVLLYEAVKMILGFDQKFGSMIKNIIIGGILINFSFFITGVLIDTSNIVSLAIYRGITAQDPSSADGGLSGALMGQLKVQSLYDRSKTAKDSGTAQDSDEKSSSSKFLQTVLVGSGGVMIMITTGLSFLAASLAFLARFIILVFLLAFSPIWFVSMIFPGMKQWSTKFSDQLKSQLIFMPIYLYLLYAAMSIVSKSSGILGNTNFGDAGAGTANSFVALAVNYAFIIVMLNLPLVAGLSLGGMASDFMNKIIDTKKFSAQAMWGGLGRWTGNRAKQAGVGLAQTTGGRAASALNNSNLVNKFATTMPGFGKTLKSGLGKAGAGFEKDRKEKVDERKKFIESLGHDEAKLARELEPIRDNLRTTTAPAEKEIEKAEEDIILDTQKMNTMTDPEEKEIMRLLISDKIKVLEQKKKELKSITDAFEKQMKAKEKEIKDERKVAAIGKYETKGKGFVERATGNVTGSIIGRPSKFNRMVVDAVNKQKTETEKIIAALKDESKKP